jgi:hypothetical protein
VFSCWFQTFCKREAVRCLVLLSAALLVGCGDGIRKAPAVGQVKLAGQPVGPGIVILEPVDAATVEGRRSTTLKFAADGKIAGEVLLGKHWVIIQSYEGEFGDEGADTPAPPKIPLFYGDPTASKLSVEIVEGENKLDFDLKAKP